jgi:hypothetical protein
MGIFAKQQWHCPPNGNCTNGNCLLQQPETAAATVSQQRPGYTFM